MLPLQQLIPEVNHREIKIVVHVHCWSIAELLEVAKGVGIVERGRCARTLLAEDCRTAAEKTHEILCDVTMCNCIRLVI